MILDKFFVHLRHGEPGRFLASRVLSLYGRLLIGGPSVDQIPGQDEAVRRHLAKTYFDMPVDRTPAKRNYSHEVSALWVENLRQEEHPQVARAVVIASSVLCTVMFSLSGALGKSAAEFKEWRTERAQEQAQQDAREYAMKRAELVKALSAEVAGYDAKRCLQEATALRLRDTEEKRDRYNTIEAGCADKRQALVAMGQAWSLQQCADYAIDMEAELKANPAAQRTWADHQVFHAGCSGGHDLIALQRLINKGK